VRIFYHAINGSGLGHLMRLSAVAEAVSRSAPDVHQLIATSANYEAHLRRLNIPAVILPADDSGPQTEPARRRRTVSAEFAGRILWHLVREYDPDVLVFDTHASSRIVLDAKNDGLKTVLVLRRCRPEILTEHLDRGRLADHAMLLVPYTREEFAHGLPSALHSRLEALGTVKYVGGIAFPAPLEAAAIDGAAARHGISPDDTLILVTAGSGGYEAINREFITRACAAAETLRQSRSGVRVVCVGGPYADGLSVPEGSSYVASDPLLQLLIARSDLTVAHAGYNTTQEILRTGARAVLVPIYRHSEDQAGFAEYLQQRRRIRVMESGAPAAAYLRAFTELLAQSRPARQPVMGADLAAAEILRLAGLTPRYTCGERTAGIDPAVAYASPHELAERLLITRSRAAIRVDWDLIGPLFAALGRAVHNVVGTLEADLGEAEPPEWECRIRSVYDVIVQSGFDRSAVVMSLYDASGGRRLAALAERVGELRFRALVARVPEDILQQDPGALVESVNACRRIAMEFKIDIAFAGDSSASVDQP
jgi:predicted glycosyltransferase